MDLTTNHSKCAEIFRCNDTCRYAFVCFHCGQYFELFADISDHIGQVHNNIYTTTNQSVECASEEEIKTEIVKVYNCGESDPLDLDECSQVNFAGKRRDQDNLDTGIIPDCSEENADKSDNLSHCLPNASSSEKPFKCNQCDRSYNKKRYLGDHMRNIHAIFASTQFDFICGACNRSFNRKVNLLHHLKNHRTEQCAVSSASNQKKPFKCNICMCSYSKKRYLGDHIRIKHSISEPKLLLFICDICSRSFNRKVNLLNHFKTHRSPKTNLQCSMCNEIFSSKQLLNQHLHDHVTKENKEIKFKCTDCDETYNSRKDLLSHLRSEHLKCLVSKLNRTLVASTETFKCDHCECSYLKRKSLNQHLRKKHDIFQNENAVTERNRKKVQFKCDNCGKQFDSKLDIQKHLAEHALRQTNDDKPFKCTLCERSYSSSKILGDHMRRGHFIFQSTKNESGQSLGFKCDHCGKAFANQRTFLKHLRSHSANVDDQNVKSFHCIPCDLSFTKQRQYNKHMIRHTDVKPFSCDLCGRSFRDKSTLQAHERMHSGEKPYQCFRCGDQFYSVTSMNNHIRRLHKDIEKKYKCETCAMKFHTEYGKKVHEKIHNGQLPFECTLCDERFELKKTLRNHRLLHFENDTMEVIIR